MSGSTRDAVLAAQPAAHRTVAALLDGGGVHAVLLSGAPGSGPVAQAEWLAAHVLCPSGGGDGCDVCARIERRVHPDLLWVRPESGRLTIDAVRSVVERVSKTPFEGAAHVVVLEHADSLASDNADAGNSLLKVLEEPPGRVVFVLLAARPQRLLPTIRSRVVEIPFPPVADAAMRELLTRITPAIDPTNVELAVRTGRGDVERAIDLATGGPAAQRRSTMLDLAVGLVDGSVLASEVAAVVIGRADAAHATSVEQSTAEFDALLETMSADEQRSMRAKSNDQGIEKRTARRARRARVTELTSCLDELAHWWRDLMVVGVGAADALVNEDRRDELVARSDSRAAQRAVAGLDAIDEAVARLTINNADEPVMVGAVCTELAALAGGRTRARRTLGAPARTPAGYDVHV